MKKNNARCVSVRPFGRLLVLPMALAMIGLAPETQAANYSCNWNANANGSWLTSALWSSCNGAFPNNGGGNTFDATIDINTGPFTVDLNSPVSIGTLTISQNTLNNSSMLTTSDGVTLGYAGTLRGGTYVGSGGTAVSVVSGAYGTLDNVILHGNLDLTGSGSVAYFANGLAVRDVSGSNPGVINVTGAGAWLQSQGTQTLDNATLHLGGSSSVAYLYSGSGALTLGANLQVLADGAGSYGQIYGGPIVNEGSIAFSNGSASNTINPSEFTNKGTITVAPATALYITPTTLSNTAAGSITGDDGSFIQFGGAAASNAGTITMNGAGGATVLQMGYAGNLGNNPTYQWQNTGTINVTDTDLLLGGYFTQADVGTINRSGGTVKLNGFLENSGQTLDITASSPLDGLRMAGGTIHGGTVLGNAAANLFATDSSYGTLDSVTLHGNLDITGTGSYAIFTNGLSVKDSSGTNPGVVNVTGFGAYLYSQGTQTLDKATVHLGGSSGPGYIYSESGTLTLGADLHVLADGVGSYGQLYGAPIINEGSIAFTNGHYNNYINPSEFTNKGTITVAPATALYITPGTLTNTAAGSITGDDGSFIQFGGAAASNAGTITMNGAGGATVLQMGYAGNPGNNPTYQWQNTGTINVTDTDLLLGGYFTQADVGTINRSGGTVKLNGFLENSGQTLDITASSPLDGLRMAGGTIHGGTVLGNAAANLFATDSSYGTLDNVTLHGNLDVTGTYASAAFTNGLSVKDSSGTNPGVVNVTGFGAYLYSQGTQTLDKATVHLGGSSGPGYIYSESGTLTLGADLHVLADGVGSYGQLYGAPIINEGSIAFTNGHYNNYINPSEFTNKGTITVAPATALYITPTTLSNTAAGSITGDDGSFIQFGGAAASNAGTITMNGAGGATVLQMGYAGNPGNNPTYQWQNTGTINVTDTDLLLGGYFTQADVGTINRSGGTVKLNGFLENSGQTLDITASSPLDGLRMAGGTIRGGTVLGNAAANLFASDGSSGWLDGVTLHGDLDVTGTYATAYFVNGLSVKDSSGTNPGVVNVTGLGAYLYSQGTQTLDKATVHLGGSSGPAYLYSESGTLTLGADLQILADGAASSYGQIYGGPIVNNGSIAFSNGSSNNNIIPSEFTNNGSISSSNGSVVLVAPTTLTNLAAGTLTGGSYQAYAGSEILLQSSTSTPVTTLAADVVLSGADSQLRTYDTVPASGTYNTYVALDDSLTTITAAGALHVLANRDYTTSKAINNQGTLELGGGTFASTSLANAGTLRGFGRVTPAIVNTGLVRASGGTLIAQAGVNGTGNIQVDSGATLDLSSAAGASSAQRLSMDGALNLGGQNLVVSKDYSNANFGTGNSFDRRSNVSGAGRIIGQNAAQTVVGQVVSAGANTFTVDFGNVRGGTTANKTFQVQNSGTGADIRGAVQSTGTGNVTDGRLSVSTGNFGPLAVGANSGDYTISFSASSGGALVGQKAGVASNFDNVATQTINIDGFASVLAQGSATPNSDPVNLGNFRVGFTPPPAPTQNFEVVNLTSGVGAERLGIGSAATTGNFAATNNLGSNFIDPGGQQSAAVTATVNNGVAGVNSGAVTLQYTTNGQLIDPLFVTQNVNAQTINLQATGYNVAVGSAAPDPVVFANQRVGGMQSQILSVTNTAATGSFTEKLNASFGSDTGSAINNGGSVIMQVAGSPASTAMAVRVNTDTAGARSGSVTLNYQTDGTGSSGLGTASVGSQVVNVSGNVYQIAQANLPANVDLGNFRLGSAGSQAINIANTDVAPAGFQEGLDASIGGTAGKASASGGPISNLAQGGNSSVISVGIDNATASAGVNTGTVTINLASNGSTTSGLASMALTDATINVSGTGYNAAVGSATPDPVVLANQRVGGMLNQVLTVTNTAAAGSFTEKLNASFGANTGNATNTGGAVVLLAAGDPGSTAMSAGVDTTTAGAKAGSVTLNYQTDGNGSSGLAAASAGSQVINVSGNVYQLASGQINTLPLNFGTVQVGQAVSQVLSISNTASGAAGFVEDLNAVFGASSGTGSSLITGSGSISGLLAGATNASGMTVNVDTSAAATINGTIAVNFASAGAVAGSSNGLGTFNLGSVDYGVQGLIQANVINAASPVINNSPIDLGNVRVGDSSPTALVSVTNQATSAPQAALNATISGNGPISAGGSFNLLNPGSTNSSDLQVAMNTATAGAINGTATIAFVSDASNVGGCAPNCEFDLPSQNVTVTGGVYQIAQPNLPTSVDVGAFRLGSAANQAINIANTDVAPAGFQEGLDASIGGTAGKASASGGPISNLAQGGNSSVISVGIDNATASAGVNTGTVTINLASNGSTTSGLASMALTDATINVSGTGYNAAVGSATPDPVVLANQRVGGMLNQVLTVTNTAAAGSFTEKLNASFGANTGNATNTGGAVVLLAAGDPGSTAMSAGVDTTTAGAKAGSVTLNYQTDGNGSSGLAAASAGSQVINVSGSVYQLASGQINTLPLNFGTVQVGQAVSQVLSISNTASGAAGFVEDLNAVFGASSGTGSSLITGSGSISGLLAGATNAVA
jgi:hypothetical protein